MGDVFPKTIVWIGHTKGNTEPPCTYLAILHKAHHNRRVALRPTCASKSLGVLIKNEDSWVPPLGNGTSGNTTFNSTQESPLYLVDGHGAMLLSLFPWGHQSLLELPKTYFKAQFNLILQIIAYYSKLYSLLFFFFSFPMNLEFCVISVIQFRN